MKRRRNHWGKRLSPPMKESFAFLAVVALLASSTASALSPSDDVSVKVKPAAQGKEAPPPDLRPRLTLEVPSVRHLVAETARSNAGVFQQRLFDMLLQSATEPQDVDDAAFDPAALLGLMEEMKTWPDTSLHAALFAPDREGRARWTILIDWPVADLRKRLDTLRKSDLGESFFADVSVRSNEGGFELVLDDTTLAVARAHGKQSLIASHADLQPPAPGVSKVKDQGSKVDPTSPSSPGHSTLDVGPSTLLRCSLKLTGTEKDSGATFLSKFSAVTGIDFTATVDESGQWGDSLTVHWPPITGTGAKVVMGRVKHTFFVPDDSFGAVAVNSMMIPGMLDGMAGFGPQVMISEVGQAEIVGEMDIGPIAKHGSSTICLTLLPGTGFFPVPDIVIQTRGKSVDLFEKDVRRSVEKVNKTFREREQSEPWHEETVRDRTVFWSDGSGGYPGAIMPFVMHPVIFLSKDHDAKDKERDYIVMGWTTTSPQGLVRRWLDLPRTKDYRYLPAERKTNGQMWVHWSLVYQWLQPYVNVALSGSGMDTLLPDFDDIESKLTSAMITSKLTYTGMTLSHTGPFPLAMVAVPSLVGLATGTDDSGDTDLSRERLACRRLRVLYHHAKLFRQDHDRWPAEVAELDGYVDFAGNSGLLKLQLSSKQQWGDWFKAFVGSDEKHKEKEENNDEIDDATSEIDDSLYVIDWGKDKWTLGFAPGTLLHLDALYIDQDGKIHRKIKTADTAKSEEKEPHADASNVASEAILELAGKNPARRFAASAGPNTHEKE